MATTERTGIADFYERDVLPALVQRLDQAFPEFAWQRDARGWHATNQEFTHTTLGVRADRVVCHGDAPRGFLIHGQGPVLWTTYVNGGHPARGREFVEAVRNLAERAGIEIDRLDRPPTTAERKANLLHDAFALCQRELASDRGEAARDYLHRRGIPTSASTRPASASCPTQRASDSSSSAPATRTPRSPPPACSPTHAGPAASSARGATNKAASSPSGRGRSTPTTPTGTSTCAAHPAAARSRTASPTSSPCEHRAATTRSCSSRACWTSTSSEHTRSAPSPPSAGQPSEAISSSSSTTSASNASCSRSTTTLPVTMRPHEPSTHRSERRDHPRLLDHRPRPPRHREGPRRAHPPPRSGRLAANRSRPDLRSSLARARPQTGPTIATEDELARRAALARAGAWLGHLPARLAVEQTTALDLVANTLGYDTAVIQRAFRARFWSRHPTPNAHPSRASGITR